MEAVSMVRSSASAHDGDRRSRGEEKGKAGSAAAEASVAVWPASAGPSPALVAALCWSSSRCWRSAGREVWRRVAPMVAGPRTVLAAGEAITITKPPEWIVGDVRGQVIHNAGLDRRLSILDPGFVAAIENAFALASVGGVGRRDRKAVSAGRARRADLPAAGGGRSRRRRARRSQLLPVDAQGIHLPADDVPAIRLQYLPRMTGVVGPPPRGSGGTTRAWRAASSWRCRLADDWESLHLFEIVPSARPEIQGDRRYFRLRPAQRRRHADHLGGPAAGERARRGRLRRRSSSGSSSALAQYAARR